MKYRAKLITSRLIADRAEIAAEGNTEQEAIDRALADSIHPRTRAIGQQQNPRRM